MSEEIKFEPQPGQQAKFNSCTADIAIYGGAAGGGKSYGLLLETLRHAETPAYECVIFRRERPQITNPGGLWDKSHEIFPLIGGVPRESSLDWTIPGGLNLKFAHMQLERDMYAWQGSEVPFIGWDELTHFTRKQFFYMLSRNRSMSGSPGYIRATCNADADSWVRQFIAWWIDPDTGLPIPERDGVLRWFVRVGDDLAWADSKDELIEEYGVEVGQYAKSLTFIHSTIYDNKKLLEKDPSYLANLKNLDRVERGRLLDGNWNIKATAGEIFRRSDFEIIDVLPKLKKRIRYWDRASTKPSTNSPNPDWTVGLEMGQTLDDQFIVIHVERFREGPLGVERRIKTIASSDKPNKTTIGIERDPGSAGEAEAQYYVRALRGYDVRVLPVHKDKLTRAKPLSAQAEAGNVKLMKGDWNEAFLMEYENFPPTGEGKDDQVDAGSGAFNWLTGDNVGTMKKQEAGTTLSGGFARDLPEW